MKIVLPEPEYVISADVLARVIGLLESEQFISFGDGDEDNNYNVIEALDLLKKVAGIE